MSCGGLFFIRSIKNEEFTDYDKIWKPIVELTFNAIDIQQAHEIGHIAEIGINKSETVISDYVVHGVGILIKTVKMTF